MQSSDTFQIPVKHLFFFEILDPSLSPCLLMCCSTVIVGSYLYSNWTACGLLYLYVARRLCSAYHDMSHKTILSFNMLMCIVRVYDRRSCCVAGKTVCDRHPACENTW